MKPVHNPKVKEFYMKVLTGGKSVKSEIPMTEVRADRTEMDFGTFPWAEKQKRLFTLTNTGQHVLVIHDVVTSCIFDTMACSINNILKMV